MITHRKSDSSLFMADFAASDRRSVHAHLAGTSVRARTFSLLDWTVRTFRLNADTEAVFAKTSRFFYKRRKGFSTARRFATTWFVRATGLAAGAMLFSLFMQT